MSKIAIIGGTGGLGRAIALNLATKGETVTVYGRTFRDEGVKNLQFVQVDLSLMRNVKNLVDSNLFNINEYRIVLFTAGIFAASSRQETSEGLERDMATSYLNRFILLAKSLPQLKEFDSTMGKNKTRIFIMAYPGNNQLGTIEDLNQEKGYSVMKCHMNTVAGNEALVTYFKGNENFNIYGLNPGFVKTNIRDNLLGTGIVSKILETAVGWFNKTPEQYANVIAPLLLESQLEKEDGSFYNDKGKKIPPSKGFDRKYAEQYIQKSEELLERKGLL